MIHTVSETLWVDTSDPSFKHDGLLTIRDDAGGQTLVDVTEIPALIEALQKVASQVAKPTQEFAIGQQVRITRRETWQGDICTITKKSGQMYWLQEHGWRRFDEIEAVEGQEKKSVGE